MNFRPLLLFPIVFPVVIESILCFQSIVAFLRGCSIDVSHIWELCCKSDDRFDAFTVAILRQTKNSRAVRRDEKTDMDFHYCGIKQINVIGKVFEFPCDGEISSSCSLSCTGILKSSRGIGESPLLNSMCVSEGCRKK